MRFPIAAGLVLLLPALAGCNRPAPGPGLATENPLYVDPDTRDFSQNPELLDRVQASPHGYLRLINIPFTQEVCRRFGDLLEETPPFNLHGDAHLEQYAVTDLGRGLIDFDDSSEGPAVIDLVRFGVSLYLTSDVHGWSDRAAELYDEFLRGYREALEDPNTQAPEPAVVARLEADFEHDRKKYFEWVETILDPVPEAEQAELLGAMAPYIDSLLLKNQNLSPDYFKIIRIGYLRIGIGSALDLKYLVRIQGATDDPLDDIFLEVKEVRDLTGIDCISVGIGPEFVRIIQGQNRIAYQPYSLLGYVRFGDLTLWVHAWVDNYVEIDITQTFQSSEELAEVAYDVGVQLGRGHPKGKVEQINLQLRQEQLRFLERDEEIIKQTCRELADQVTESWELFRSEVRQG